MHATKGRGQNLCKGRVCSIVHFWSPYGEPQVQCTLASAVVLLVANCEKDTRNVIVHGDTWYATFADYHLTSTEYLYRTEKTVTPGSFPCRCLPLRPLLCNSLRSSSNAARAGECGFGCHSRPLAPVPPALSSSRLPRMRCPALVAAAITATSASSSPACAPQVPYRCALDLPRGPTCIVRSEVPFRRARCALLPLGR